jgi:hypothetical protein
VSGSVPRDAWIESCSPFATLFAMFSVVLSHKRVSIVLTRELLVPIPKKLTTVVTPFGIFWVIHYRL